MIQIADKRIPLRIVREKRPNIRAAIGKKEVILRLPSNPFYNISVSQEIDKVKHWLLEVDQKRDGALDRLAIKEYIDGQQLRVGESNYILSITEEDRQTHSARLRNGIIQFATAADARAWYESADYQAVKKLRDGCATAHFYVLPGA